MEKEIKIKIDKKGELQGTVGYLCRNASTIKIGETKRGLQGAWLYDDKNKKMACLAVRGYFDDNSEVTKMRNEIDDMGSASDFIWSNAAWNKIEELQDETVIIMDEIWEKDDSQELVVSKK